jgi:hypothetical protein
MKQSQPNAIVFSSEHSSREKRIVFQHASIENLPRYVWNVGDIWPSHAEGALPVGSVEYLQDVMKANGMSPPIELGFPSSLHPWIERGVVATTLGEIGDGPIFVKPRNALKIFNGFVFSRQVAVLDEFEMEQHAIISALPDSTLVWISPVVELLCEWRYYVTKGIILGYGRYDPSGKDDAPEPSFVQVEKAIAAYEISGMAPDSYAIDFGVTDSGQTILIEVNDAWAIGYYTGTLTPASYVQFLYARWSQLALSR